MRLLACLSKGRMQAGAIALLKSGKRPDRHGPDERYQDASGSEKGDGMSAQKWAVDMVVGEFKSRVCNSHVKARLSMRRFSRLFRLVQSFPSALHHQAYDKSLWGEPANAFSGHGPGNVAVVRTGGYHKARVRPGPKLDVSDELPLVEFPRATRSHTMYDTRLLSSSSRH